MKDQSNKRQQRPQVRVGGGATSYNGRHAPVDGLYGETPSEMGTFFRL